MKFYWIHWLVLIACMFVWVCVVFRIFYTWDHIVCQQNQFDFFLSNLSAISFLLFSPLNNLAKTSNAMLNMSDENEPPYIMPLFRIKAFNIWQLNMMLDVGFHMWPFIYWGVAFLFITNLLRVLNPEKRLNFVKWFLYNYWGYQTYLTFVILIH